MEYRISNIYQQEYRMTAAFSMRVPLASGAPTPKIGACCSWIRRFNPRTDIVPIGNSGRY